MELIILNETQEVLSENEKKAVHFMNVDFSSDYEKKLKNADWDVFCEFTSFREGLVNWYPFRDHARTLLLSDGYGALVGVLARMTMHVDVLEKYYIRARCIVKRYADVLNVRVLVGTVNDLMQNSYYDYIIVEKAILSKENLQQVMRIGNRFLNKDGRMLFVCPNRFGMKYWCGVPDTISGKPFGGMKIGESTKGFTRRSLIDVLESDPGEGKWKIYYPFPDDKLPQVIYTDEYLPQASVRDRVIFYYTPDQKNTLIFLEDGICDSLISNGVFQVFANSFFIEYARSIFKPIVRYAALSTDRGKEHGFATIIYEKGIVRKKALHSQGVESLKKIYRNHRELENHGISCVSQRLIGNYIEMPYLKEKTLIEYLKELYEKECNDEIVNIFDHLYEDILNSSNHVMFDDCSLNYDGINEKNAGIILQEAYIDMIPYNCFVLNRLFVFYDQEFVRKNYPAKYVLFRALRYTYFYVKEAESVISLQYFKEKYKLTEVWKVFEQEEAHFVEDNRNYDLLDSFYNWAGISQENVDENIKRLIGYSKGALEDEEI